MYLQQLMVGCQYLLTPITTVTIETMFVIVDELVDVWLLLLAVG